MPAQAQESLPAISFDSQSLEEEGKDQFTLDSQPTFNFDNAYLNDTLRLQYQNILLEKMILRQGTIARTEKSFMDVGVPFNQPAPPRGICEQIPVNIPCYKAYPDLYPGAVPDVGQIEEGALDTAGLPAGLLNDGVLASKTPEPKKPEKISADFSAYRWAEITCAGGRCSAVLSYNGARRGVKEGDTVGDGFKVARITSTGVDLSHSGETKPIEAALAPSRGGMASPKYAAFEAGSGATMAPPRGSVSQQAQQIQEQFATAPAEPVVEDIPPATISPDKPPAQAREESSAPVSDPGPPLGATGLF